jgi:hypothetical protein
VKRADARASALAGEEVTLDYAAGWREPTERLDAEHERQSEDPHVTTIEFRGYAYTRTPSPISGELVTAYDPKTPQVWRVPFRKNTAPSLVVKAPRGGYVVEAGHAREIGERLAFHGIAARPLDRIVTVAAEAFRATSIEFARAPYEGRMRATLQGEWRAEQQTAPAGSLFVPIAQPLARLAMALLEPQAPDSFAAWGFFNSWFEQKEYLEPYVVEIIAREMLQAEPALAAEFRRRLENDADFAGSPTARREFFQRRHASWDRRFSLYPVYRVDRAL